MATLLSIVESVRDLVTTGSYDSIETMLESASTLLEAEADASVLMEFAETCHAWGPPALEEAALRVALARGAQLDALEQLLDILLERGGMLSGAEKTEVVVEAESLGGEALRLLGASSGVRWANLIHARGSCRTLLAQVGKREHGPGAWADLLAFRNWVEVGVDVPDYWVRAYHCAIVDLEIAELDILEGRGAGATRRLESAIATIEASGPVVADRYMVERGYELLMLAEEQERSCPVPRPSG